MVLDEAIRDALKVISEHPQVQNDGKHEVAEVGGVVRIEVTFKVNLPNAWRAKGKSPSGVTLRETVRFDFPNGYPLFPPELSLRADFSRNVPHMQPWTVEGRPVPCIYDGEMSELLHLGGFASVLNQTAVWLHRAALGDLIDPNQGWEPVRRDALADWIVAEAKQLQGLVDNRGGFRFVETRYLKLKGKGAGADSVLCQLYGDAKPLKPGGIRKNTLSEQAVDGERVYSGKSLALVVWPGKMLGGQETVCHAYLPETVMDVDGLKKRASLYGCSKQLADALGLLKRRLHGLSSNGTSPLVIILLARRPFHLIGSSSAIEVCPYIVDIVAPKLFPKGSATQVRPAAHRSPITRELLARMAGWPDDDHPPADWTLLGAGSVGSKLAIHLARAGVGPSVVVDKSSMAPHNAARHALIPRAGDGQTLWAGDKAFLLTQALAGLNHEAKPMREDAIRMLPPRGKGKGAWSKRSLALINATASLALREALGAAEGMQVRVVETALYASGRVGVVTVEGPDRNPNTVDLMAEVYASMGEAASVRSVVFGGDESVTRQRTGQGCGSLTMTVSDGRLSLFAAGAAEYLLGSLRNGLPRDGGEVLIGRLCERGLGVDWESRRIKAPIKAKMANGTDWRVRIHQCALAKMEKEASRWPNVETGGVLMGRVSEVSKVISVVDVLDGPENSQRSPSSFVLGTEGLRRRIEEYSDAVDWSLYCLGTWHSHLGEVGPSATDRDTLEAAALARLTPTVFLVKTPTQFHALTIGT